jgi:hypothetical protein
MRIAAKRLRYILEIAHPCFGEYAKAAVRATKELQDLLGEIHDCDVQMPAIQDQLDRLIVEDAAALTTRAGNVKDLAPEAVRDAPGAGDYAGIVALLVHLRARRDLLYARFLDLWRDLERRGHRARLEFAILERPGPVTEP